MSALDDVITLANNVSALAASLPLPGLGDLTIEQRGLLATYKAQADALALESLDATVLSALSDIFAGLANVQSRGPTGLLLAPSFIAGASVVHSPTVVGGGVSSQSISPSLLASAATVYSPTVTPGGPPGQTVSPALVATSSTLYSPTVSLGAAPATPQERLAFNGCVQLDTLPGFYKGKVARSRHLVLFDTNLATMRVGFSNYIPNADGEIGSGMAVVVRAWVQAGTATSTAYPFSFSSKPDTSGHPGNDHYALIPAVPTSGSGGATIPGTHEGVVMADQLGEDVPISAGTYIWITEWRDGPATGSISYLARPRDTGNGWYLAVSGSSIAEPNPVTLSGNGGFSTSGAYSAPAIITVEHANGAVIQVGDSRARGQDDEQPFSVLGATDLTDHRRGYTRLVPLTTPSLNLAQSTAKAETLYAKSICRRVFWPYCSHLWDNSGYNDAATNNRNYTQIMGYREANEALLPSHVKYVGQTIPPVATTSVGHWGNPANQTAQGGTVGTALAGVNDAVRASPAWQYDKLELDRVLESATDSRKWKSPSSYRTLTDLTVTTLGGKAITSAAANWTSADQGLAIYLKTGPSGAALMNTVDIVNGSTGITTLLNNTTAGDGTGALGLTKDGVHEQAQAYRLLAAATASQVATMLAA